MPLGLSPPRVLLSIHLSSPLCGFGSLSYCLCRLVTDPKATLPPLHSCTVLPSSHLCLGASLNFSLDSVFPSDYFDHTFLIVLSISFPLGCMPDPPGAALSSVSTPPTPTPLHSRASQDCLFSCFVGAVFLPVAVSSPLLSPPSAPPSLSFSPHLSVFIYLCLSVCLPLCSLPPHPFQGLSPWCAFLSPFSASSLCTAPGHTLCP